MKIGRKEFSWIGGICSMILLPLSGCHHRDFIKVYENGTSARQPLTVGGRTYVVDSDHWCSEVDVQNSTGTRSWRTGLHRTDKYDSPMCKRARYSQDGRYLLVPQGGLIYSTSTDLLILNKSNLPISLIIIDLVQEREIKRIAISDPETFLASMQDQD